jgi:RNA polymerase sigma factor (sigma-70 family)
MRHFFSAGQIIGMNWMDNTLTESLTAAQDREIASWVRRERGRLLRFIRRRVLDAAEAEDILQDALYELVAAHRLMQPVEQVGAWLMAVVRNRIIDRFRRRKRQGSADRGPPLAEEEGEGIEDLLPSPEDGPLALAIRERLLERVAQALDELPPEQRDVFISHELERASFNELSERWGVGVSTLLSRKRYAVLQLRRTLRGAYEEWLSE